MKKQGFVFLWAILTSVSFPFAWADSTVIEKTTVEVKKVDANSGKSNIGISQPVLKSNNVKIDAVKGNLVKNDLLGKDRKSDVKKTGSGVKDVSSKKSIEKMKTASPLTEKGKRPLELDWAERFKDDIVPFLDFEKDEKWTVDCSFAEASFKRSDEHPIWDKFAYKLTYRATEETSDSKKVNPIVRIHPPKPIPLPKDKFDTITCWVFGDHWGRGANTDLTTPVPSLEICFQVDGKTIQLPLTQVFWRNWFLVHRRLNSDMIEILNADKVFFNGFVLTGGTQLTDREIFLDDLAFFTEEFKPIKFSPRSKRGINMFPGQDCGLNTGEGRLPFPTTENTIIPPSAAPNSKNNLEKKDNDYLFTYEGSDGKLVIRYKPVSGSWSDFTASYNNGPEFHPLRNGGIVGLVGLNGSVEKIEKWEIQNVAPFEKVLVIQALLTSKTATAEVRYHVRLMGKTLVLDSFADGGKVAQVSFGEVGDLEQARAIPVPYFTGGRGYSSFRPAVIAFENKIGEQLFISGEVDWYRSNASECQAKNSVIGKTAVFHDGVRYIPKTDGKRNDLYERFIVTISPKFDETLPFIANPVSPYKHIAGTKLWRVHAAHNREQDKEIWKKVWRYGIREVVINDHETQWRDGGEGFTFRTRTDPKKGGDKAQLDYSKYLRDTLGFVYGPYNNFTDFATVNEFWSPDMVGRMPDKEFRSSWMRTYGPKPSKAVEYCEKLSPILKEKFYFNTAYCDVHTSVSPWSRTDYDARVPGAGTFAATYYAYGEIMLLQKKAWQGPVYSEGPNHYYYSGLTDGNYAQDQGYKMDENPWLVDFDLLRIHDLECNFGMGNLGMFSPAVTREEHVFYIPHIENDTPKARDLLIDRFLAATAVFGHPGFLILDYCFDPPKAFGLAYGPKGTLQFENGIRIAMRSYYLIQQIAARYTQTSVESIAYTDDKGALLSTSEAIAFDAFRRSQPVVRYKDGTIVAANGSKNDWLKTKIDGRNIELAPGGFIAWTKDKTVFVESNESSGNRFGYAVSPEYIYLDVREGEKSFPMASGSGAAVCRYLKNDSSKNHNGKTIDVCEIIMLPDSQVGFAVDIDSAVAIDFNGKELGAAHLKNENGYVFIDPVPNAFSYIGRKVKK